MSARRHASATERQPRRLPLPLPSARGERQPPGAVSARRRLGALRRHLAGAAAAAAQPAMEPPTPHGIHSSTLDGPWDGRGQMLTVGLEAHAAADPSHDIAAHGLSQQQMMEWTSRGLLVLTPEQLRTPPSLHEAIFARGVESSGGGTSAKVPAPRAGEYRTGSHLTGLGMHNYLEKVPELMEVLNNPAVDRAISTLIGEGWAIVPWTHNMITPGDTDQHW